MDSSANLSKPIQYHLILIALIQGLILLFLHQSLEFQFWPYNQPQWLFPLYSLAIALPIMLLLGLTEKVSAIYKWVVCYAILIALISYYTGSQVIPLAYIGYETLLFSFIITITIATFKALMYVQHSASGKPLTYSELFLLSWRNFLTLSLSFIFTLATWGVLMLWAALFMTLKIDFFYDLFTERWFYYPALALANGFGIIIFRQQSTIIDTITRIFQALMKFLLVVLVFVSIIFLATLPFTGLSSLWATGGSKLILALQGLLLFIVNAVYQDKPESRPYPIGLHRFIYIGIGLLPIYSIISFYGLSLRVEQYGWSLSRCWAFVFWGVFSTFSLGYLWGIIKQRDQWLHQLSWVNVRMGLLVLTLMLLVNSPLIDFRKIAVHSQIERYKKGKISLENMDIRYFRYQLAKPGYDALQTLKNDIKKSNPVFAFNISSLYTNQNNSKMTVDKEDLMAVIKGLNANTPENLNDIIYSDLTKSTWRLSNNIGYHLITTDMNDDGQPEYILIETRKNDISLTMYSEEGHQWVSHDLQRRDAKNTQRDEQKNALLKAIESDDYSSVKPDWKYLKIGNQQFQVP